MPKGSDPSVLQYVWPPAATQGAVGGTVSADFWMVRRSAKNPVLAHTFINWVLGKEQAQKWYELYGLQLPQNDLTPEKLISLGIVPEQLSTQILTPDDFDLGQWVLPLSEEAAAASGRRVVGGAARLTTSLPTSEGTGLADRVVI